MAFSRLKLARLIDYTLIKATATKDDGIKLCQNARKYEFRCVVANPFYVSLAHRMLNATNAKVCSTVGFPIGVTLPGVKAAGGIRTLKDGLALLEAGADRIGTSSTVDIIEQIIE